MQYICTCLAKLGGPNGGMHITSPVLPQQLAWGSTACTGLQVVRDGRFCIPLLGTTLVVMSDSRDTQKALPVCHTLTLPPHIPLDHATVHPPPPPLQVECWISIIGNFDGIDARQ